MKNLYLLALTLIFSAKLFAQWLPSGREERFPRTVFDISEIEFIRDNIKSPTSGFQNMYNQITSADLNNAFNTAGERQDDQTVARRAIIAKNAAFALLMNLMPDGVTNIEADIADPKKQSEFELQTDR